MKVTKEEFYSKLPKGYKYKSMLGDPISVVYYVGNWDDETFKKVGQYWDKYGNDPEEYILIG